MNSHIALAPRTMPTISQIAPSKGERWLLSSGSEANPRSNTVMAMANARAEPTAVAVVRLTQCGDTAATN